MPDPRTPVLIGAAQTTWRKGPVPPPRAMLSETSRLIGADAGLTPAQLASIDLLAVIGFAIDTGTKMEFPRLENPPATLSEDIGAKPRRAVYTTAGGNTPQALVNWAADEIASGRQDMALLVGAEYLGSLRKRIASGDVADLGAPGDPPEMWGDNRPGCSRQEQAHGLAHPVNTYPLFENALRVHRGRSIEAHNRAIGEIFAPFTKVAAANPHAWFPIERSAQELMTESPDNRMIGFPYPKYVNAILNVDQAAGVLMCSSAKADELGIPQEKRVYLHGCAEGYELWDVLDRQNYYSSPVIRTCAAEAFGMAGKTPADVSFIDIYSCFPVAVEIACAEMGIAENDPRGFTVTGGLPYAGGPGNNYVMHSIATMVEKLRGKQGSFGLVTANGWYLTKQAYGVYSTTPKEGAWNRRDPKSYQKEIDALPHPEIVREPSGEAVIETYTVTHARDKIRSGIVIGRDANNRRFVANTPDDEATLYDLQSREGIGRKGRVTSREGGMKNIFVPE